MASVCVNGEHLLPLTQAAVDSLPAPFGVHDFETLVVQAAAAEGLVVLRVKDVYIRGIALDKKRLKGFDWQELKVGSDEIIGVVADIEAPSVSDIAEKESKETKAKKGAKQAKRKGAKGMDMEKPADDDQVVGHAHKEWYRHGIHQEEQD